MLLVDTNIHDFDLNAALQKLPPSRRDYALSYRFERDRRLCVLAWLLLKKALFAQFGLSEVPEIAYGSCGKPYFPAYPDIFFNLSHCHCAVACIVDRVPVGIDVENFQVVEEMVMKHALSPAEFAWVKAQKAPIHEFFRLWTRKEAVLKLRGSGLGDDNLQFLLSPPPNSDLADGTSLHSEIHDTYVLSWARDKRYRPE